MANFEVSPASVYLNEPITFGPGNTPESGSMWLVRSWINDRYLELARDLSSDANSTFVFDINSSRGPAIMRCTGDATEATAKLQAIRYTGGKWDEGGKSHQVEQKDLPSVTFKIPNLPEYGPGVLLSVEPVDGLNGSYIKGRSRAKLSFYTKSAPGSTVIDSKVTLSTGQQIKQTGELTSDLLTTAGDITIIGSASDGRGFVQTATQTITVLDYAEPKITKFEVYRCDVNGQQKTDGAYIHAEFMYECSAIDGNECLMIFDRSSDGGLTWEEEFRRTNLSGGGAIDSTIQIPENEKRLYRLRVTDKYATTTVTQELSTAKVFIGYNNILGAWCFGREASDQDANKTVVATDFVAEGNASFKGNLTLESAARNYIIDIVHPVGTVLWLQAGKNPNTLFPGTSWKQYRSVWRSMSDTGYVIDVANGQNGVTNDASVLMYQFQGRDNQKWSHALSPASGGNAGGDRTAQITELVSNIPWLRAA